tara:strand:+ start:31 stop:576 length:546 start_codon:yes stop_codon:yes gene_type:complete
MKKKLIVFSLVYLLIVPGFVAAKKDTIKDFPKSSLGLDLASFTKLGEKLVEFSIFSIDVYVVSYYEKVSKDVSKARAINLNYKMNVSRSLSIKGWNEGFKWMNKSEKNKYKKAIKWIHDSTGDLLKRDNLTIFVVEGITTLKRNNKTIAVTGDPLVGEIILGPWVGEKPIREDVRKALLGK